MYGKKSREAMQWNLSLPATLCLNGLQLIDQHCTALITLHYLFCVQEGYDTHLKWTSYTLSETCYTLQVPLSGLHMG